MAKEEPGKPMCNQGLGLYGFAWLQSTVVCDF